MQSDGRLVHEFRQLDPAPLELRPLAEHLAVRPVEPLQVALEIPELPLDRAHVGHVAQRGCGVLGPRQLAAHVRPAGIDPLIGGHHVGQRCGRDRLAGRVQWEPGQRVWRDRLVDEREQELLLPFRPLGPGSEIEDPGSGTERPEHSIGLGDPPRQIQVVQGFGCRVPVDLRLGASGHDPARQLDGLGLRRWPHGRGDRARRGARADQDRDRQAGPVKIGRGPSESDLEGSTERRLAGTVAAEAHHDGVVERDRGILIAAELPQGEGRDAHGGLLKSPPARTEPARDSSGPRLSQARSTSAGRCSRPSPGRSAGSRA